MRIMGIDLGGTQIRAATVENDVLSPVRSKRVPARGTEGEVLQELFSLIDEWESAGPDAIGIGVPSVVDVEKGIVYDVLNIPSWKEVPLKAILEARYGVPVLVNNDANCFALGEKYFGAGRGQSFFIGLTVGTGLGAGIVLRDRLFEGPHCGAGEFGMVDYQDQYYEYYASGQFFRNCHDSSGEAVYARAGEGDPAALAILRTFGTHLGNAVKMILYTYDAPLVILGGSISRAYRYFEQTMWDRIRTFAYPKSLEDLSIRVSDLGHAGILGAASLYYDKNPGSFQGR